MIPVVLVAIFLVGFGSCQHTVEDCPPRVTRDEYLFVVADTCYEFVLNHERDYPGAESDCESKGGILALVKTKDIQDFIVDKMQNTFGVFADVWIGLNDRNSEAHFVWEDGTKYTIGDFANWAPDSGPGTNSSALESHTLSDCVAMDIYNDGQWVNYHCSNELFGLITYENRYICQYRTRLSSGA